LKEISRRTFLKVTGGVAGSLLLPPGFTKAFSKKSIPMSGFTKDGGFRLNFGLGEIRIGEVCYTTERMLKGSLGMASVAIIFSSGDKFRKLPLVIGDYKLSQLVSLECSFQKPVTASIIGEWRVEALFIWEDGIKYESIIFPRAQAETTQGKIVFTPLSVIHEDWKDAPLGRMDFGRLM